MVYMMIIDDHAIVRMGMKSLLETKKGWRVVCEAASREEALDELKKKPARGRDCPHLAILDLVLGPDDGLELIKELTQRCPEMDVLVVSVLNEAIYAERVLQAGAKGFLAKKDAVTHLLEAVNVIHRGGTYLSHACATRLSECVTRDDKIRESGLAILSDRELHVFHMVGSGLTNKEIAESLGLSRKTIETYKENIKRKLGFDSTTVLKKAATLWSERGLF